MPPFSTYQPWFSLSQRKKKPRQDQGYRKRKDMVSAPQPCSVPSSLPLLFAADSIGHVKMQRGSLDQHQLHQRVPLPTPRQTPRHTPSQTPNKATHSQIPIVNGKSYGTLVGADKRKRKPVLKLATDESAWRPPQSPFNPRPPSSGSSPVTPVDYPPLAEPPRRCSPPARLSPRSNSRTSSSSSRNSPPVPPRPQRRIVSGGPGPASYVPPPPSFSALGPRPISAFPVSSRPAVSAGLACRPTSLPADTADIYNFFLGNNVTRKRVDFHEISPRDMRDLATDARGNKRAFVGSYDTYEQRRKSVKPRESRETRERELRELREQREYREMRPAIPPKPVLSARQASSSPSSADKVWFAAAKVV